jgi:hypothetical protein
LREKKMLLGRESLSRQDAGAPGWRLRAVAACSTKHGDQIFNTTPFAYTRYIQPVEPITADRPGTW